MGKPKDPRPRAERRAAQKKLVQEILDGYVETPEPAPKPAEPKQEK